MDGKECANKYRGLLIQDALTKAKGVVVGYSTLSPDQIVIEVGDTSRLTHLARHKMWKGITVPNHRLPTGSYAGPLFFSGYNRTMDNNDYLYVHVKDVVLLSPIQTSFQISTHTIPVSKPAITEGKGKCYFCGGPAYEGLNTMECLTKGCK